MEKYYILNTSGGQEGPLGWDEISFRLSRGEYSREMLVKCGETGKWATLESLFQREEERLDDVFGTPSESNVVEQNELPVHESPQQYELAEIEFPPLPVENSTVMPEQRAAEPSAASVPHPGIVNVVELSFMLNVPGRGQEGPLRESVIRERLSHGLYPAGTLILGAGMDSWEPLESLFPNIKAPAAVPPPLPQIVPQRMYYVHIMGKGQTGPYPGDLLQLQVQTGVCPPGTLIWTEGMPGWEPIERYFNAGGMVGAGYAAPGATSGFLKTETYLPHISFICCFRRYFKASGRASRAEFWWFWFLFVLCQCFAYIAAASRLGVIALIFSLFWMLMVIPLMTAFVRRMHDTGNSGILAFVPVFNLIMALFPSDGPNTYGNGPARPYDK